MLMFDQINTTCMIHAEDELARAINHVLFVNVKKNQDVRVDLFIS